MSFYRKIETVLSETTGQPFNIEKRRPIGGGFISAAECLSDPNRSYFLKTNRTEFLGNFEAETDSLDSLAANATIRIPKPIALGIADDRAYLLIEYIQPGSPNTRSWSEFGRQLAALHKTPQDTPLMSMPPTKIRSHTILDTTNAKRSTISTTASITTTCSVRATQLKLRP